MEDIDDDDYDFDEPWNPHVTFPDDPNTDDISQIGVLSTEATTTSQQGQQQLFSQREQKSQEQPQTQQIHHPQQIIPMSHIQYQQQQQQNPQQTIPSFGFPPIASISSPFTSLAAKVTNPMRIIQPQLPITGKRKVDEIDDVPVSSAPISDSVNSSQSPPKRRRKLPQPKWSSRKIFH